MSWLPVPEPSAHDGVGPGPVDLVIESSSKDLGGFRVRRALPSVGRRMVGPFVFFDHMGPALLPAGEGMDVRPHPHIGLATLTYLTDGEVVHRDSLCSDQEIVPGDVNWMTAGRGIVHSERSSAQARTTTRTVAGLQSWVALPKAHEETAPGFFHHPGDTLPGVSERGVSLRLIAGHLYGQRAPVHDVLRNVLRRRRACDRMCNSASAGACRTGSVRVVWRNRNCRRALRRVEACSSFARATQLLSVRRGPRGC